MRRVVAILLALCVSLVALPPGVASSSGVLLAQESSDPPELGPVVVQDALTGTGPFRPRTCSTGHGASEHVEDGFRIRIAGRCVEGATAALMAATAVGFTAANGEISIETKVVEGHENAWVGLIFREQSNGDSYGFYYLPSQGQVRLRKSVGSITALLAENGGFGTVEPDSWARLSIRFSGQRIWGFVNDELVISVSDPSLSRGGLTIITGSLKDPDAEGAVAVIWRNLKVSAVANEAPPTTTTRTASSGAPSSAAPSTAAPASAARPPAPAAPAVSGPPRGTPPVAGQMVHEEPLTERGIIPVGSCPTGKGRGEVVGEGFLMAVRGKCTERSTTASVGPDLPGLSIPDGEIRFDFKVTNNPDRATVTVAARLKAGSTNGYVFAVVPGAGTVVIGKLQQDAGFSILARRTELGSAIKRDDWNTLAVRMSGPNLWLLINDQPILATEDDAFDTGSVGFGVGKTGTPDDEQEVAVVFRNLSVSRIEGAPDDRAPSYVRPSGPPPGAGSVLSLLPLVRSWSLIRETQGRSGPSVIPTGARHERNGGISTAAR